MIKYGLKLWSTNTDLFKDSIKSINKGEFNFIEIYIIPEKFNKNKFKILKEANINISFHLPHSSHNFNPIDKNNNSEEIWNILKDYINYLNPFKIVLHPEYGNNINILEKRLKYFNDKRIIIENMPKKSSINKKIEFYGYNEEQIIKLKKINNKFCFDFAKAKSSAISQGLNIIDYFNNLIKITNPEYFHISGFLGNTEADEHFDLWEGDIELMKFVKNTVLSISNKKDIFIVFECRKKDGIINDLKNLNYFLNMK